MVGGLQLLDPLPVLDGARRRGHPQLTILGVQPPQLLGQLRPPPTAELGLGRLVPCQLGGPPLDEAPHGVELPPMAEGVLPLQLQVGLQPGEPVPDAVVGLLVQMLRPDAQQAGQWPQHLAIFSRHHL
ncbi:hypothetical protein [Actinomadura macra]|uniref:hypothetical protein n=1 Tax=Actinomadura macra TaxID=46164 RepID=UPI0012F7C10C|nr:hypothetical protein [Actinomadura macra]